MPLQQTNAYIVYIDISIRAWKIVWTHPSRRTSNNLPQIKPCTNSTPRFVAGSGSGVPGGGETKNKSQRKIAGFFQKMKKYWSKFRSIKKYKPYRHAVCGCKTVFQNPSFMQIHTHMQPNHPPNVCHAESNLDLDPSQKEKRDIQYCYWHAIDTDALSSGANYFN